MTRRDLAVLAVVAAFLGAFAWAGWVASFDPGAAEGPYRKREACRAVCK